MSIDDWKDVRQRASQLTNFDVGGLMGKWWGMLGPILDEFVNAAAGKSRLEFWDRICHQEGAGSGPRYLCGWSSVFCVFDENGKWQGNQFSASSWGNPITNGDWPVVDTNDIPPGMVSVPVTINDNGTEHESRMFAGHLAYQVTGETSDTLQPRLDWVMALVDTAQIAKNNESRW